MRDLSPQTRLERAENGLLMAVPVDPRLAHLARPANFPRPRGPYNAHPRSTVWLSGCTNPPTADAAGDQPRLGLLAQPGNSIHRQANRYTHWAIDNGAFGKALRGTPWTDDDTEEYLDYLARVVREVDTSRCMFATAPDVLEFVDGRPMGDAEATWERSRRIFPRIRALGLPAALVAQDGILTNAPFTRAQWDQFDVLFLGGSDVFKLGEQAQEITRHAWGYGKWVHMGRVNSLKRLQIAKTIGADSADGTFIGFGPAANLPKVLNWLDRTEYEPPQPLPMYEAPPLAEVVAWSKANPGAHLNPWVEARHGRAPWPTAWRPSDWTPTDEPVAA